MDLSKAPSVLDETEFGLQWLVIQQDSNVFLCYNYIK